MKQLFLFLSLLLTSLVLMAQESIHPRQINSDEFSMGYPKSIILDNIQQQIYQENQYIPQLPSENKELMISSQQLLDNPELLKKVMLTIIRQHNITGLETVLPIYRQSEFANPYLIAYAEGILLLYQGKSEKSAVAFHKILQDYPYAEVVGYYYALANFYNKNYALARYNFNQLDKLSHLPIDIKQQVDKYNELIHHITSWKFNFNLSFFYDRNINNAPDNQQWGRFRFSDKKSDFGITYQGLLSKKFIFPQGFYFQPNFYLYGKQYYQYRHYNDFNSRIALTFAKADQYNDFTLQPYAVRRLYGEKAYSYTLGNQVSWLHHWHYRFSTLFSLAYEHQYFDRQKFFNNHRQIFNLTSLYALTAKHTLLLNQEVVHQYATRDSEDSYWGWSIKADWRTNWDSGLGTNISFLYGKNKYKGPTLLTQQHNRKDRKYALMLQLKHRKLQYAGFQPEISLQYYAHRSNSALHSYTRKEIFFNINKIF
ncbi:uncharacterized protein DUF560 [Volucribacter psittacicida]|uniref:Uncharacterized protein DUF560 n=1 Tax=Volucribacter psittacicida TaxID=203482 RepID=A0A4R1FRB8_9PAST|nr:surface lipoprotein assembly modifier [Volucribacter psittacicida]TCJ96092.1 uncharacterized protein DUF560 [Volucribacter psittacicida]